MKGKHRLLLGALSTALVLGGCSSGKQAWEDEKGKYPPDRNAIAITDDWYGDSAKRIVYLDQNWSPAESDWFYNTTQGSELMNYNIFINLEEAVGEKMFISKENMSKFRYLPQKPSDDNPDGLPVGFVRNKSAVGLTCAACHTNQINYQGTGIRVDGAPAQANMVMFLEELAEAMRQTLRDDDKFDRFAKRILGEHDGAEAREDLQSKLRDDFNWVAIYNTRNYTHTEYGFARVDAVGRIYNQVLQFTNGDDVYNEPNAPVSYPFLWDTPQHDWVQWVGLTANANVGALGRNSGEVIGVFGRVEVKKHTSIIGALEGYTSTVETGNLVEMEEGLRGLWSPQWPRDILPDIDAAKAARGETLYNKHCAHCHHIIDRTNPTRSIRAQMIDMNTVGTDKTEILNAVAQAPTGILNGAIFPEAAKIQFGLDDHKFGDKAPIVLMLADLVEGVLVRNAKDSARAAYNAEVNGNGLLNKPKEGNHKKDDPPAHPFNSLMAYKARPLNGIWATAPYLHNGSVPNLYSLLLPPDQRPMKFAVGQLEYDPKHVGFRSDVNDDAPFIYHVSNDDHIKGNSNQGHEFGTDLHDDERWALVEYLKTL